MNAVAHFVAALPRSVLLDVLARAGVSGNYCGTFADALRHRVMDCFAADLAGFLNSAGRDALVLLAARSGLDVRGRAGVLRARLWRWGAEMEAGGVDYLGTALQPVPIVLGGKLRMPGPARGQFPPAPVWPRPVPLRVPCPVAVDEPECLEDLLQNANTIIGVRLGRPSRDKGAYGTYVAALLGVRERGHAEPDWRGQVEIKTVPVVRDRAGWWRVKEDPAISMATVSPLAKLERVLWIARVAHPTDSVVLGWYYQEADAELRRLTTNHLHTRPKGRAGACGRGWYLHKRFFLESGFLRVLNG